MNQIFLLVILRVRKSVCTVLLQERGKPVYLSARARIQKKINNRALFIDRVPILHVCILVICDYPRFV